MSNPLTGCAPGYWGRNISARVNAENVIGKVSKWNFDKIMAMGLPFAVWREASSTIDGLPDCSCVKDTAKQADVPCLTCYGTGKTPGYLKFGTRNYWLSSVDPSWVLTNLTVDKQNRPFRLQITDGQSSGTAVSGPITIDLTGKLGPWESKADGFTRDGGANSSSLVEFSINDGATWFPLTQLEAQLPTGSLVTSMRFRVTLARSNAGIKSPMFEIVRARFPTTLDIRNELAEPVIRAIPTWDKNAEFRTPHGNRIDATGKRFWTMPLTWFDATMDREAPIARLQDDVFVEVRYGGNIGFRFALVEFDYSDTFGKFTRQEFGLRQYSGQPGKMQGEFAYRVF